jgi:hypothetical protein
MLERVLTCCVHGRRGRDDTGNKHNSESKAARIYPKNTEIVDCCNRSPLIGLTNHGWFLDMPILTNVITIDFYISFHNLDF